MVNRFFYLLQKSRVQLIWQFISIFWHYMNLFLCIDISRLSNQRAYDDYLSSERSMK